MKRWSVMKMLVPWFVLFAVTSCGPMSLTGGNNDLAGGGIGGTGISVGKITAFGSVWVNGIEFDTTGSKIIKDGVSVLEVVTDDKDEPPQHLSLGMIVTVRGEFSPDGKTGKASSIEFNDNLEGPISAISVIDPNNQTFEVLGQSIKVDGNTLFDGTTNLSTLAEGNVVEVSGFVDANGIIHASYVSLKSVTFDNSNGAEIELKGTIENIDPIAMTFMIGNQTIGYSNAIFKDTTVAALANGLYVEVKSSAGVIGSVLIAGKIELEDKGHNPDDGDEFEVEGYVTALLTDGKFEIEGQTVQINASTRYGNGTIVNIADITVDMKIEVKGTVDAYGVLVADKIKIESGDDGDSSESDHVENGENDPS